ncbi:MAG: hypothetical protein ACRDV1_12755 [Actinomycetes bacterium]
MTTHTSLPLSPVHAAALARVADLRREAEQARLARSVTRTRRHPAPTWPATVMAALRDSLRGTTRRPAPAPTDDRAAAICCA